jgi:hypothetical protein
MGRTSIFELDVDTLFRAGALFTARGFSYLTIKALVLAGIDAPERLLFADEADLPAGDASASTPSIRGRAKARRRGPAQ